MKFFNSVILVFASSSFFACKKSNDSDTFERTSARARFHSVGMVTKDGQQLCSGTLIRHGLFITAKHCFQGERVTSHFKIIFSKMGTISNSELRIQAIKAIDFDIEGNHAGDREIGNDIAYMLYDPIETRGKVDIEFASPSTKEIHSGMDIKLVGYPQTEATVQRVVSENCKTTGTSGVLPPKSADPGYDGLLFETNCEGWHGLSGGPVLSTDSDGLNIFGVVTHTFDVDADGNVKPGKNLDEFGQFANTNFSPFSRTKKLAEYLVNHPLEKNTEPLVDNDTHSKAPKLGIRVVTRGDTNNSYAVIAEVYNGSIAEDVGFETNLYLNDLNSTPIHNDKEFSDRFDQLMLDTRTTELVFQMQKPTNGKFSVPVKIVVSKDRLNTQNSQTRNSGICITRDWQRQGAQRCQDSVSMGLCPLIENSNGFYIQKWFEGQTCADALPY